MDSTTTLKAIHGHPQTRNRDDLSAPGQKQSLAELPESSPSSRFLPFGESQRGSALYFARWYSPFFYVMTENIE